jgi:hypothetical protein
MEGNCRAFLRRLAAWRGRTPMATNNGRLVSASHAFQEPVSCASDLFVHSARAKACLHLPSSCLLTTLLTLIIVPPTGRNILFGHYRPCTYLPFLSGDTLLAGRGGGYREARPDGSSHDIIVLPQPRASSDASGSLLVNTIRVATDRKPCTRDSLCSDEEGCL